MSIREPADWATVGALWRSCRLMTAPNDPSADVRFTVTRPNATILVADDRIVGSVVVGHDGQYGGLYLVAAEPDDRRSGTGRAVVAFHERLTMTTCRLP